jgi:hypothetical protein
MDGLIVDRVAVSLSIMRPTSATTGLPRCIAAAGPHCPPLVSGGERSRAQRRSAVVSISVTHCCLVDHAVRQLLFSRRPSAPRPLSSMEIRNRVECSTTVLSRVLLHSRVSAGA